MKSIPREGKPRKNILDKLAEFKNTMQTMQVQEHGPLSTI